MGAEADLLGLGISPTPPPTTGGQPAITAGAAAPKPADGQLLADILGNGVLETSSAAAAGPLALTQSRPSTLADLDLDQRK